MTLPINEINYGIVYVLTFLLLGESIYLSFYALKVLLKPPQLLPNQVITFLFCDTIMGVTVTVMSLDWLVSHIGEVNSLLDVLFTLAFLGFVLMDIKVAKFLVVEYLKIKEE